jgi:PKD repeat protein
MPTPPARDAWLRPILVLVLLTLLGSAGFVAFGHGAASPPSGAPQRATPPVSSIANYELQEARSSLGIHPQLESKGGYTWNNITTLVTGAPSPRFGPAMTWDSSDGYVLLYGGENVHGRLIGGTWSFQNGTWTNLTATVTGSPPAVVLGSLASDPTAPRTILFGGLAGSGTLSQATWAYHNRTWTNVSATSGPPPAGRVFPIMVDDTTDAEILLFSGSATGSTPWMYDTWTYKGGTWTNITATAGYHFGVLQFPVGSDDPSDHGVLAATIYASGFTAAMVTLLFSGGAWQNLTGSVAGSPPLSAYGCAGYLGPISSVVYYSGLGLNATVSFTNVPVTAEFNASSWTNATSSTAGPPDLVMYISCAVNKADGSFLVFGGVDASGASGSSWLLSAPPKLSVSANHLVVNPGSSVSFTGSVSKGASPFAYHWNFGDGTTATTLSGAHAYAHPGTYVANLTVTDLVGHTVTSSVSIVVNPPLSFSASATPTPATANLTVALTSALSGGTAPYSYHWSLGDGSTSTAASLGHSYAKAGNYTVIANVTDALGASASSTFTLEVNAAPHASSSSGSSSSSSVSLTSGTGLYLLLGIVLLAIVVVALALMLARRPQNPPGPPAQYYSGQGAPPAGAGPMGAAPPPAWSETPPPPPPR